MKYLAYCRKSSEEESKQVQSLETQERMLMEYATKKNLEVIDIIKESKSAKTDGNRPLFTHLIDRITRGDASGILVLHTDRLSRNGIESGRVIKLFESGFLEEICTPTRVYASAEDLLYIDFDFVFAAHYSRNLSIRVKEGNATKLAKGEYIGRAPLGYTYLKNKIVPDPIRARHITKAFSLYSTGYYTLLQIKDILHKDGFRSRLTGNKLSKTSIHIILLNPVYYGVIRNQGALQKGIHKPLTTKETFNKVQLVLQGKNRSKKLKHDFLYRNYLTCGNCHCKLTASVKKQRYNYYYCTNGKKICDEHKNYMDEKYIFKIILNEFQNLSLDKELADLAFDIYIDELKSNYQNKSDQREILVKQIANLDKKLSRLLDLRLEEAIDKDSFLEKQRSLKSEKAELEIALLQVKEHKLETTLELLLDFKKRACSLGDMFNKGDEVVRADLLKSALWNLQIKNKKVALIQYKPPYEYVKNLNKTRNLKTWLAHLDWN